MNLSGKPQMSQRHVNNTVYDSYDESQDMNPNCKNNIRVQHGEIIKHRQFPDNVSSTFMQRRKPAIVPNEDVGKLQNLFNSDF